MDIKEIRKDFPILDQNIKGRPLIYFDNAATAQRPLQVTEITREYSMKYNANIHRATHFLANKTTEAYEKSRETVREFLNAKETAEVIFTHGTTESINLVASSFGRAFLKEGDEVIVSEMEHHANIVPWQIACERSGAKLKVIPFNNKGDLELDNLENIFNNKTKILAVAHVSNTLGTINPIVQLIRTAHAKGVPVLIDGAQGAPHFSVDVQALDCDFYCFSGHKVYGPTGIGVLYGKREWLDKLPPFLGGGEMISKVTFEKTDYNELPYKFEAGTPHYIGAIGLAEALKYLQDHGKEELEKHERELSNYLGQKLRQIKDLTIYGTSAHKAGVYSFNIEGIHPFDLGTLLDQLGVAVRTGRLCADPVMDHYGCESMVRASLAFYNTFEEVDSFYNALIRLKGMFM
jgi:cysteine desulfurase/selenocysteine lyase